MTAHLPIIKAKELNKYYTMDWGSLHALKNINLTIMTGELVAIMGASGSGKSSLMYLLGCLDKPSSGTYEINNVDTASLNDKDLSLLRANKIGFVFQSFNLIPQLNVFENVAVPFSYQSQPPADYKEKISKAILRVGLQHRMHHLPSQLSGGEMQRVAIARALAIDPVIVLADEPTGNLDSNTGNKILELFAELNAQGVTIIIVTHDINVAHRCKRIITMQDGSIMKIV